MAGPSVWNSLPDSLRNPVIGGTSFIQSLKTFLFAMYWCIQRIWGFTTLHYINQLTFYLLTIAFCSFTSPQYFFGRLCLLRCCCFKMFQIIVFVTIATVSINGHSYHYEMLMLPTLNVMLEWIQFALNFCRRCTVQYSMNRKLCRLTCNDVQYYLLTSDKDGGLALLLTDTVNAWHGHGAVFLYSVHIT